jgi:hypothetical protein
MKIGQSWLDLAVDKGLKCPDATLRYSLLIAVWNVPTNAFLSCTMAVRPSSSATSPVSLIM